MQAMDKEWSRLRAIRTWDEDLVCEWKDVVRRARQDGRIVHVGRLIDLCMEKGAELPEGHPERKFKGRVVFGGDNVRDQDWNIAMFQELSSSPSTMAAARSADCYGMLPGHVVMQSDAEQAYTQAALGTDYLDPVTPRPMAV